jgi:3-oxoacyl-[acyl-carrier protein] reductase
LIAGSSRGIGRAIAAQFLEEGARVLISGRHRKSVGDTRDEFVRLHSPDRVLEFVGDLTQEAEIRNCIRTIDEQWGTPDIVVANVGTGKSVSGWQVEPTEFIRAMQVNFFGSIALVEALLPRLVERRSGSVVLINSIAGVEATAAPLPYASAKSALAAYSKNLSRLMAPHGVRINSVAPGNIFFAGGSWETRRKTDPAQVDQYIDREVPMKRFGTPEEIANIVVFLASSRASFATGLLAVVDGGQTRTF